MNFFEHQDKARSTTRKLVVLFVMAIIVLITMTSFLVIFALSLAEGKAAEVGLNQHFLMSEIFILVSLGVLAVVGFGSIFRFSQLKGGGKVVAESLGGRLLNTSTRDADERKILNVVEEMAIASGLPVPPVYLMEESSINAFAAGYQSKDAVIGVTRGCIQLLDRDELQGVMAHEFSHIFNGDMRLNIRLMGFLYGIMVLGMIGYFIMRGSMYSSIGRSSNRDKKGGGIIALGLGLVVIGYGGTFFGNMIKAAVSRQREFLADASAVQFTRNPEGISGALKKIGGFSEGSRLQNKNASEVSHMLFGEGVSAGFSGLFATHPRLQERILKIDPTWRGKFEEVQSTSSKNQPQRSSSSNANLAGGLASGFSGEHVVSETRVNVVDSIGNPSADHLELAAKQIAEIPSAINEEAHTPFGASALMYALLIQCSDSSLAEQQLELMKNALSHQDYTDLHRILGLCKGLSRELYLPLVDIALPSLKQLSPTQYRTFMSYLSQLMVADEEVSLFEWSLFKILRYNLDQSSRSHLKRVDLKSMSKPCEVLLSALAGAGHSTEKAALSSFNIAQKRLNLPHKISFIADMAHDTQRLEQAIDQLEHVKPLQKPKLLKAMVSCIDADGVVTPEEKELLRAIASLLDCPIPPLLSGQDFL